jgi:hypothetical protein
MTLSRPPFSIIASAFQSTNENRTAFETFHYPSFSLQETSHIAFSYLA